MKNGIFYQRGSKQGGFTLVELLVVISIIALLVSILMPSLNKAKEAAKTVMCAANLSQGMMGIRMYSFEYNGRLPGMFPDKWYELINTYTGSNVGDDLQGYGDDWLRCPSAKKEVLRTYGANYPTILRYEPGWYVGVDKSANLDKVPSTVFILGDHGVSSQSAAVIYHPEGWLFNEDRNDNLALDTASNTGAGNYNGWSPRHSNKGNMVYADNSVRPLSLMKWEDVWIDAEMTIASGNAYWDFWGFYGFDSYD